MKLDIDIPELIRWLASRTESDLDAMLESRDDEAFDSSWKETFDAIGYDNRLPDAKKVFTSISNATGHHEIVRYIAEDLDLLHTAYSAGHRSEFIRVLGDAYSRGRFPYEVGK